MHVWTFTKVVAQVQPSYAISIRDSSKLFPRPTWFPEARLNFTQNMLESPYITKKPGEAVLTCVREGGEEVEDVTLEQLRTKVARMANAMRIKHVVAGDRIACIAANTTNTLVVFLATASLCAIFTSCSPEGHHDPIPASAAEDAVCR
ncbi:hypothetical protein AUEXF2481DRAFT_36611 [Aureobasidium subglaciale EXF-2481]|uniref:AMP-dependent synthetase/ligase domain-containing protein n=1 Tax=Aureobasidium subglaciale (strain EXF-2481) TaxID=1043005 RepID=A0A074YK26_AURSE|nr:uncharacterized protein AUEXF2481DRAFT_36611 [Aureobasidium subglaciale EXF-2481]KEQ98113.1 hypothetical protein AUEXF2481DRAFT_36611 [Aureobasidium subglaciale EXF-2481]